MPGLRDAYVNLTLHGPMSLPGQLAFLALCPFSLLFGAIAGLRGLLYRHGLLPVYRATVPVISVGNLAVGGTGKTPVTDALVKRLLARGRRVAVVSRGYGGSFAGRCGRVAPDGDGGAIADAATAGDEPFLLARKNPSARVYVARKRRLGVIAAEADGADCIVLDDAFQHRAVHRELDIVLLDARNPFGNGWLLPAGILREPRRALRRADRLILTHAQLDDDGDFAGLRPIRCRHRLADYLVDADGGRMEWAAVAGRRVLAFAGIARPADFFAGLREHGCFPAQNWALADHQEFGPALVARLRDACRDVDLLLSTEKDAVKLRGAGFPVPCLAAPLELEFADPRALDGMLDQLLKGKER